MLALSDSLCLQYQAPTRSCSSHMATFSDGTAIYPALCASAAVFVHCVLFLAIFAIAIAETDCCTRTHCFLFFAHFLAAFPLSHGRYLRCCPTPSPPTPLSGDPPRRLSTFHVDKSPSLQPRPAEHNRQDEARRQGKLAVGIDGYNCCRHARSAASACRCPATHSSAMWPPVRALAAARTQTDSDSLQRQLYSRSDRVKGIDFHPHEPWVLTTLYNGTVTPAEPPPSIPTH